MTKDVWRALGALVVASAASASCVAVRYQARNPQPGDPPAPPMQIEKVVIRDLLHNVPGEHRGRDGDTARPRVTANGLEEQPVSRDAERSVVWQVRIQAGARTEIAGMMWSPASAPRCAGGHPAFDILVADTVQNHWLAPEVQVHWERPVAVSGEQVVAGRFDEDRPLLHEPSVVDVMLVQHDGERETETCVRLPATGPGLEYWNLKRWSVGGRFSWRRALPFSDASTLSVGFSVGRWVGPVRIGIEAIAGGTNDRDMDSEDGPGGTGWCFLAPGPDCDDVAVVGGALEASGIAWRWDRWAVGWSVAYETLYGRLKRPQLGGTRVAANAVSGGPRLAIQLLRAVPSVAGVSRASPTSAWGFELFAATGQAWTGPTAESPLTFGVSLLGF